VPREIVSVTPFTRNRVPSVVTNDGTCNSTVTRPFASPIAPLAARATSSAGSSGRPA
jgi:hypothetical protein